MTPPYTKSDLARILQEKPRTIKSWTDLGLVVPDVVPSSGRGVLRLYSHRNLLECLMVEALKDSRVYFGTIKIMLETLREGTYQKGGGGKIEVWTDLGHEKALMDIKRSSPAVVEFKDFYTNPIWGQNRELICISYREGTAGLSFHVVERNRYGTYEVDPFLFGHAVGYTSEFRVLMLGKMLRMAMKRFRL